MADHGCQGRLGQRSITEVVGGHSPPYLYGGTMKRLRFTLLSTLLLLAVSIAPAFGVTSGDLALDIPSGKYEGVMTSVNKFGRAPSGVQTTATDIWDRATQAPLQSIWVAPTQARQHNIASDSTSDDGAPAGVGARTIRIYGLTDWDTVESSEDIVMNGTTDVLTVGSYVIIHRMKVLTKGATAVNVGAITDTAVTDGTVTAQINDGEGQTQMAIYGIPSIQDAYITRFYGTVNKASGGAATINFSLMVNPEPDSELVNFLTKNTRGAQSTGNSGDTWPWNPYMKISGPAIIKVQGIASGADVEGSAGFDLILMNNTFH